MKKTQPIRMCISCRSRHPQTSLIRLKLEGKDVIAHNGKVEVFTSVMCAL